MTQLCVVSIETELPSDWFKTDPKSGSNSNILFTNNNVECELLKYWKDLEMCSTSNLLTSSASLLPSNYEDLSVEQLLMSRGTPSDRTRGQARSYLLTHSWSSLHIVLSAFRTGRVRESEKLWLYL